MEQNIKNDEETEFDFNDNESNKKLIEFLNIKIPDINMSKINDPEKCKKIFNDISTVYIKLSNTLDFLDRTRDDLVNSQISLQKKFKQLKSSLTESDNDDDNDQDPDNVNIHIKKNNYDNELQIKTNS